MGDGHSGAAPEAVSREDLKGTAYELFILGISILSIVNIVLATVFEFRSTYWWLVFQIDIALTLIFVIDFTYRLRTAPSKGHYFKHGGGVFDLLGCLPLLRIFRLFRISRAVRVIRQLGGPRVLRELRGDLAEGTLYLIVFLGLTTLEFVGLLELYFEQDAPGANITTGGDALWWGYVTATTVGYGDYYPVTTGGRLVGTVMLTVGVALFATFSGFLANTFLSRKADTSKADTPPAPPDAETRDTDAALREVERLLAEQQQATDVLRARVLELQKSRQGGSS
jgi:voltage-gated potassium channel